MAGYEKYFGDRPEDPSYEGEVQEKEPAPKRDWKKLILGFAKQSNEDQIGTYAGSASYFMLTAFIPFVLFLTTLVQYTSLSYNTVREAIVSVVPQNFQGFVLSIVVDIYRRSSAIMPLSALAALWSAGKGLQSLADGLNTIYRVKETRNWLFARVLSVLYTLLMVIVLILGLFFMVLGQQLQALISGYNLRLGEWFSRVSGLNSIFLVFFIFLLFVTLYRFLPNRKSTFRAQIPGAVFTTAGWLIFSLLFSLYFRIFPGFSNTYGNLTAVLLIMIWLYISMIIILLGAEVNSYAEQLP